MRSEILNFPEDTEASFLKSKIEDLGQREDVDGILVQLPLPSSLNSNEIITTLPPEKDVDGFHPSNLGNLLMNQDGLKPCTPAGILELLKFRNIPIEGKRVVIVGRSLIVGKPLAAMMTNENGTVTICHSKTKDLPRVTSEADILIAAIGRGAFIAPEFVKPGAVVVDVGMNYLADKSKMEELFGKDEKREKNIEEKGYTLIGDVHPQVIEKAEYLTPVPRGVGPLTVALLMRNTLEAFKRRRNLFNT
jgi:methylenetetrahydrofolate dehydrogenase (NADP+)/methenyltetrahydrofolate cyclohydrolase